MAAENVVSYIHAFLSLLAIQRKEAMLARAIKSESVKMYKRTYTYWGLFVGLHGGYDTNLLAYEIYAL